MGLLACCFSDASARNPDPASPAARTKAPKVDDLQDPAHCAGRVGKQLVVARVAAPAAGNDPKASFLRLVHTLSALEGGWSSSLTEAAEASREQLEATHCSIYVVSPDRWATVAASAGVSCTGFELPCSCDPRSNDVAPSAVLRASQGSPAELIVLRGPPAAGGSAAGGPQADELPADWRRLAREHGCQQFAAVAAVSASGEPIGVLSLAAKGPARPAGWTAEALHCVAALLCRPLRQAAAVLASEAVARLHHAPTISDLVRAALEAAAEAAAAVTHVRPQQARLAFIHAELGAAAIFQQQQDGSDTLAGVPYALNARRSSWSYVRRPDLVQRAKSAAATAEQAYVCDVLAADDLSIGTVAQPSFTRSNVMSFTRGTTKGHTLSLANTLLSEALSKEVAGMCIEDCNKYVQDTKAYPRDLVLSRSGTVPQSLALATHTSSQTLRLALYVTYGTTLPQALLQDVVQALQQLLQAVTPFMAARLTSPSEPMHAEWRVLNQQLEATSNRKSISSPPRDDALLPLGHAGQAMPASPAASAAKAGHEPDTAAEPTMTTAARVLSFVKGGSAAGGQARGPDSGAAGSPRAAAAPEPLASMAGGEPRSAADKQQQQLGGPQGLAPGGSDGAREAAAAEGMLVIQGRAVDVLSDPDIGGRRGVLAALKAEASGFGEDGRPHSACADGYAVGGQGVACKLGLRSVSFRLEKAQSPRGASKLAPLIASMHDRLMAAQAAQMTQSRSAARMQDLPSLKLMQEIGQGGYGVVYRGTFHGAEVAVKVIRESHLAAMQQQQGSAAAAAAAESNGTGLQRRHLHDAIELVASVSLSHPNIVQVLAWFQDVQVTKPKPPASILDSVDQVPSDAQPFRLTRQPSLLESPDTGGDSGGSWALVLEYCDCGSLCDAIMDRRFIERVPAKKPSAAAAAGAAPKSYLAINMRSIYTTLLEVALSLRHMHSLALVHCDLKPQNVLLKSSGRDPRGFVAKLSDFGLSRMMAHDGKGLVIDEGLSSGTITHVSPEVLLGHEGLGAAVDIYAFGILMFQMICGMRVYDKMTAPEIASHVAHQGMRPKLPDWVPEGYRTLAKACWHQVASARPTAEELVRHLERVIEAKHGMGAGAGPGPSP